MTKKEKKVTKAFKIAFKPNCQCGGRYGSFFNNNKIICYSCGYKHTTKTK